MRYHSISYTRFRDGESIEELELEVNEEMTKESGVLVYQGTLENGDVIEVDAAKITETETLLM